MGWYDDAPSPWNAHLAGADASDRAAIIAAAEQVAEDAEAEAHMSTDHAETWAHMAVEKAFTSFAKMLKGDA